MAVISTNEDVVQNDIPTEDVVSEEKREEKGSEDLTETFSEVKPVFAGIKETTLEEAGTIAGAINKKAVKDPGDNFISP
jgi:hypothetical protein